MKVRKRTLSSLIQGLVRALLGATLLIWVFGGCTNMRPSHRSQWNLIESRERKGGGETLLFSDDSGRTRIVEMSSGGRVEGETILKDGQEISRRSWHQDGSLGSEVVYDGDRCVKDVSWYPNGQKQREYIYKNGVCTLGLVWYMSGHLSEKNVYDKSGKYVAAPRWYPNGQLKYEAEFRDGVVVRRTFYNEDGSVALSDSGESGDKEEQGIAADTDYPNHGGDELGFHAVE